MRVWHFIGVITTYGKRDCRNSWRYASLAVNRGAIKRGFTVYKTKQTTKCIQLQCCFPLMKTFIEHLFNSVNNQDKTKVSRFNNFSKTQIKLLRKRRSIHYIFYYLIIFEDVVKKIHKENICLFILFKFSNCADKKYVHFH